MNMSFVLLHVIPCIKKKPYENTVFFFYISYNIIKGVVILINKKELDYVNNLLDSEKNCIDLIFKVYKSLDEPQLRSEFQSLLSSHRNHISAVISFLKEIKNEN